AVGRGEVVGDGAGDAGGGLVELVGPVGDAVLGEGDGEGAERGGLDRVHADPQERLVHAGDDVRAGLDQHLVAALEGGAAEVVGPEVELLDVRPEGAVEYDHALARRLQETVPHPGQGTYGAAV